MRLMRRCHFFRGKLVLDNFIPSLSTTAKDSAIRHDIYSLRWYTNELVFLVMRLGTKFILFSPQLTKGLGISGCLIRFVP